MMKSPLRVGGLHTIAHLVSTFVGGPPHNIRSVVDKKLPDTPDIAYGKLVRHAESLHKMTKSTTSVSKSMAFSTSRTPSLT